MKKSFKNFCLKIEKTLIICESALKKLLITKKLKKNYYNYGRSYGTAQRAAHSNGKN